MATSFLSRVDRDSYRADDNPNVGPGAYSKPTTINRPLPGFAPFSSSSKRMTPRREEESGPAPGSYLISDGMEKKTGVTSVFKSGAKRFVEKDQGEGGPSHYSIESTIGKKIKQFPKKSSNPFDILPKRAASPPSIPTKSQAHGYEVRPDGAVTLQAPAVPGFTGRGEDTVGPGDYDPKIDVKYKNAPKTTFKGSDREAMDRIEAKAAQTPGPGYYNTHSTFENMGTGHGMYDNDFLIHMAQAKRRQMSAFESKTARDAIMQEIERRKNEPGPGQYVLPSTIVADKNAKPPNLQFFSSSEARFKNEQPRSMQVNTAPGSYNVVSSDFDQMRLRIMRQKKMAARSDWVQNIAFTSTERRFNNPEEMLKLDIPNPTAYRPKGSFGDQLARGNVRAGAFGSKDARFKEKKDPSEKKLTREELTERELNRDLQTFLARHDNRKTSGNGIPAVRSASPNAIRPKIVPNFAPSSEARLRPVKTPPGPPPGAYNTQPKWIKEHGAPVMAPELRISKKVHDPLPGPGQYDVTRPAVSSSLQNWRNPKNVMLSTAVRADPSLVVKKGPAPGPGYYNTSSSLLKPTFNVLLSEKYQ